MPRIVLIDDEPLLLRTLERFLRAEGHDVQAAAGFAQVDAVLHPGGFEVLVSDIVLRDGQGIEILRELRRRGCDEPVVLMTGEPSTETAAEAVRLWAFDYLTKPVTKFALLTVVARALRYVEIIRDPFANVLRHVERAAARPAEPDHDGLLEVAERLVGLAEFARQLATLREPLVLAGAATAVTAIVDEALRRFRAIFGAAAAARIEFSRPQAEIQLHGDSVRLADALLHVLRHVAGKVSTGARIQVSAACTDSAWVRLAIEPGSGSVAPGNPHDSPSRTAGVILDGLHLTSAMRIVAAHGGRIDEHASGSGGIRCCIVLPTDSQPPAAAS